ncbi:hypothetical protein ACET3X_002153 [Alternaria dauci]|uniref:SET domain-containing protein n=1 Tax=Alternaria dauci TaxID=48095 RepID=A0ABR3UNR7_9PLEO
MATTSTPSAPADNPYYTIRAIPNKGYGCFAVRDLSRGTRILSEAPLLVVPIAEYMLSDVEKAFAELTPAQQALYHTLHSSHGQDPKNWPTRIHDSVAPRERARIAEQHGARTGSAASLISIFQTNCMEMGDGAAVFVHASRFNHSCNPNACFSFNHSTGKENIHVMNPVPAGAEITLSYVDMMHDKGLRAYELRHYGYLDIALVCEMEGDLRMAEVAAIKALEVKRDCQGEDFPNYGKYADVVRRIKAKVALQR